MLEQDPVTCCKSCGVSFTAGKLKSPRSESLCRACDKVSIDEWELLIEKIHLQQKALQNARQTAAV